MDALYPVPWVYYHILYPVPCTLYPTCSTLPVLYAQPQTTPHAALSSVLVRLLQYACAGDGPGQHPTQALLDVYSIRKEIGRLEVRCSRQGIRKICIMVLHLLNC
jgi:hypothetical protein